MTSDFVFERLLAGITRERLAVASGLSVERLRLAEDGFEPLTAAEERCRRVALDRLIAAGVEAARA